MDESSKLTHIGARRMALAASVAAHALVLGLSIEPPPHKPAAQLQATAGRPGAAMTVRLYREPAQTIGTPIHTQPTSTPTAAQRVERQPLLPTARRTKRPSAPVAVLPDATTDPTSDVNLEVPPAVLQAPASPHTAPVAPVAGSAFAGLFAPILSTPMGRSGWSRRSADAAPTPPAAPDPSLQQQATLALRMDLLGRLNDLAGSLSASGQQLECDIAVDGPRHLADIQCADPADQGAPWSALQGLLVAGSVPPGNASLCFRLAGPQVSVGACVEKVTAATP